MKLSVTANTRQECISMLSAKALSYYQIPHNTITSDNTIHKAEDLTYSKLCMLPCEWGVSVQHALEGDIWGASVNSHQVFKGTNTYKHSCPKAVHKVCSNWQSCWVTIRQTNNTMLSMSQDTKVSMAMCVQTWQFHVTCITPGSRSRKWCTIEASPSFVVRNAVVALTASNQTLGWSCAARLWASICLITSI